MTIVQIINSRPMRIVHRIFLFMVMIYAVLLIAMGVPFLVRGQDYVRQERAGIELERRVQLLENQNIEHRITVMETVLADLQNSATWQRLNMGGTGLLIAEAVTRTVIKKREKGETV